MASLPSKRCVLADLVSSPECVCCGGSSCAGKARILWLHGLMTIWRGSHPSFHRQDAYYLDRMILIMQLWSSYPMMNVNPALIFMNDLCFTGVLLLMAMDLYVQAGP